MNKAFVRDSDDLEIRCPLCGSAGIPVPETALVNYVQPGRRTRLGSVAYFCDTPTCKAVYFDSVEDYLGVSDLAQPVYPKDPDAPICACFDLTREQIELDLDEGVPRRVREVVARAKTDEAQCSSKAASGHSCIGPVQKYYMRGLQRKGRG